LHVNNAVHYELMDTAVNGLVVERPAPTSAARRRSAGSSNVLPVFAPLQFPTVVDDGIALERLGRTSVAYRLALFGTVWSSRRRALRTRVRGPERP